MSNQNQNQKRCASKQCPCNALAKRIGADKCMLVLPKNMPCLELVEDLFNDLTYDVKIMIGKQIYECHSSVLCNYCELFAQTLCPGYSMRLPEEMISGDAFGLAYNWMTSSECKCQRGDLLDLLLAAEYLCAPYLVQSVYGVLWDKRYFPKDGGLICFAEACTKGVLDVADLMVDHFGKYFLALVAGDAFRKLKIIEICCLLDSNQIAVHTEVEVFYAALMWVLSDYPERKGHMRRVLKQVRFEMMPSVVLLSFGEALNVLLPFGVDLMYFLLHLAVICSQERASAPVEKRYRKYIRDPKCPYLNMLDEDRVSEISAPLFKDYILSLDTNCEDFESRVKDLSSAPMQ